MLDSAKTILSVVSPFVILVIRDYTVQDMKRYFYFLTSNFVVYEVHPERVH